MRIKLPCRVASMAIALLAAAACSGTATGPDNAASVEGSWIGLALLPNAYTAAMTLQQTGSAISGTARIKGVFLDSPIAGSVAPENRTFAWRVARGCKVFSGVLSISADESGMSGPMTIDGTGCVPAEANEAGTLSLDRQ